MLKAVPKKKKKDSLAAITRRLDILVSNIVRLRDKHCVICWSTQNPQCGHFIGRRHMATRFDLTNCHQQCAACNMLHNENPVPYTLFIQAKYGENYPVTLDLLSRTAAPNRFERLELESKLKEQLRDMEASD